MFTDCEWARKAVSGANAVPYNPALGSTGSRVGPDVMWCVTNRGV